MSKVSIIIPNWNGEQKLQENLPQVLKTKGVDEVIVVDDGSTDGSVALIEKEFPQIKLIKREKNSGFSSTVNLGVSKSVSGLVFILNSDAVPFEDCLKNIIPHFEDPKVFSVGLNNGGNWSWAKWEDGYFWHYKSNAKVETHQTLWVSGGSGVFRKSIWQELGGFDEVFDPFYEEDLDLGYRATKRGYFNIWEEKAIVEHKKDQGVIAKNFSKSKISKIAQRNQLYFIWKNMTDKGLMGQHLQALIRKVLKSPNYLLILISALACVNKIKRKRQVEVKQSKLGDIELLNKYSQY